MKIIDIPRELKERVPLVKPQWMSMIKKMRNHPHAPHWNTRCGDRLIKEDITFIKKFAQSLSERKKIAGTKPPAPIIAWIKEMKKHSIWFEIHLQNINPENDFNLIRIMERADLQKQLAQIVPHDISLDRLINNPTSGTTGQPVNAPNHPRSIGCYTPLYLFAFRRYGVKLDCNYQQVAAIQLCAQKQTITYSTVHSYSQGAGFAKINLALTEWKDEQSPAIYINHMQPLFLSGDPIAFYRAIKQEINYQPKIILTTAITLEPTMRKLMEKHFSCPVVDIYSLNETGPLAYSCPLYPDKFHWLATDNYLEVVDETGTPVAEGGRGEILVTGGRNPFLPLLRYRTGDSGIMDYSPCACGDPMPAISGLMARKPVLFKNAHGEDINPIDITRIMRKYPILRHQFIQQKDLSCVLRLQSPYRLAASIKEKISKEIEDIMGKEINLKCKTDLSEEDKIIPYINHAGK